MADITKRDLLANNLRKEILCGKYGSEGGIPEESEIAKNSGFARGTVNAALTLLEGEALITKRGRSYYVNRLPVVMTEYVPPAHTRYIGKENFVRNLGEVQRVSSIPEYLAEKMQIPASTPAVYCVRLTGERVDGKEYPLQISHRYYLLPLTDEQVQRLQYDTNYDPAWEDTPVDLDVYEEVVPRLVTKEESDLLALPTLTAINNLIEIIYDMSGNHVVVHESAVSPRISFIYKFSFKNRPK